MPETKWGGNRLASSCEMPSMFNHPVALKGCRVKRRWFVGPLRAMMLKRPSTRSAKAAVLMQHSSNAIRSTGSMLCCVRYDFQICLLNVPGYA